MDTLEILKNIGSRNNGDVYLGVVGPVRVGKSTFIKRFMEEVVIPNIENEEEKLRAKDELPQSGDGKTIMTVEPKFVPSNAINVSVDESVTEGQVIAKSGITGNASDLKGQDQHLHFELRSRPENIKGLTGKLDPNTVVDTKFISQDPEIRPQTNVGIIKIYKDGTEEYKDVIR